MAHLVPHEGSLDNERLINFIKSQLAAGTLVPYEYMEYAAIAARQMFGEGINIPQELEPPTKREVAAYGELNLEES